MSVHLLHEEDMSDKESKLAINAAKLGAKQLHQVDLCAF
jgi:hypothetical protein